MLFEGANDNVLNLSFQELKYHRSCSTFMNIRWNHDHEYFQRMIEWEQRDDGDIVGALITNMYEFLEDKSSSDDSSMPVLQDRGLSDSSSSNGLSMPILQARAAEGSFSDDGTMSCDKDGVYDDGEHCAYKARTQKQISRTNAIGIEEKGDRFQNISMASFKYSVLRPAQFPPKSSPILSRIFVVPGNRYVFPRAQQQQRYNNGEAKVIASPLI